MKLAEGDSIVTAYAEAASGPGWTNSPVWVIVRDINGKLRQECLQPDEQSDEIRLLYPLSSNLHGMMIKAVVKAQINRKRNKDA